MNLEVSKEDDDLIAKIVSRAAYDYPQFNRLMLTLDITVCHANGCPLMLQDMLAADDSNFYHDVLGIRANINRANGKMTGLFSPRFSKL